MANNHGNLQKHANPNPIQRELINRFYAAVTAWVKRVNPETILDAGCGEGFTLRRLQPGRSRSCDRTRLSHIIGADLNPGALAWGKTNGRVAHPLNVADARRLPFPDHTFDLVLCLEVLEHLPRPLDGLRELLRVSRGYVLVSVPHEPFFRLANFLRGKHLYALGNDPEHLQNFTARQFRQLLTGHARLVDYTYRFPWQLGLITHRHNQR